MRYGGGNGGVVGRGPGAPRVRGVADVAFEPASELDLGPAHRGTLPCGARRLSRGADRARAAYSYERDFRYKTERGFTLYMVTVIEICSVRPACTGPRSALCGAPLALMARGADQPCASPRASAAPRSPPPAAACSLRARRARPAPETTPTACAFLKDKVHLIWRRKWSHASHHRPAAEPLRPGRRLW
jgi:hypothetical protein